MLTLAVITKSIVIDFLCIRTRAMLNFLGPVVTLYTVQSKGWPFLMTTWGVYSFILLYGKHKFASNWLYWQDSIELFNETNPSGGVPSHALYRNVLILAIAIGALVTVKRFWIGIIIGRHTYSRYAADLASVMSKVLLIGQVAELARDIEYYGYRLSDFNLDHESFKRAISSAEDSNTVGLESEYFAKSPTKQQDLGRERVFGMQKDFSGSEAKSKINMLLGEWEEPVEIARDNVSVL